MLTSTPTRPSSRPFRVSVSRVRRLSPSFVRVTFSGDELHEFGAEGLDQRVKIVLPHPELGFDRFPTEGDWYGVWRGLPDAERNVFRTYTSRAVRPAEREVDVDFVCHGTAGPASAWVEGAAVGDEIVIVGPDGTSGWSRSGIEWDPREARTVLLAGDETAVPAISAILEQLPGDARGCVFLEVPSDADVLPIGAPDGVDVHWLPRASHALAGGAAHGEPLIQAVRDWTSRFVTATHHGAPTDADSLAEVDIDHEILWEVPIGTDLGGELYAWLAGEAGAIKTLRRFLVSEMGIHRSQVAFMGYWRLGKAEG
ncbi:siderophore-interacting protein [Frondihabitans cladoniiphilus]|uniref:FAD-binding FR-type domain-containing protein n=1 Tax=Frondihabitans cladoniiphilus TaxID=715785 RepID=A0ABP8VLN3_9MICO